ncbi:MAG: ribulose-phosphate 3-epimerase, partial [Atopobiaceae bacterium]|nr:ribulose-phosphate 3-epimerase [Atopobiaceae bacterium]
SADLIHYDVMDGHFVPNLSFGLDILKTVKKNTDVPVDVHLMITNPDEMVEAYLDAGADIVCFHQEAAVHAHRIVSLIHQRGAKAAMALNPATPVSTLEDIIEDLDMVLIMSVNPGYGGQKFIEHTYAKLRALRALCDAHGVAPWIEVDGGVGAGNAEAICEAGANVLVAGTGVMGKADRAAEIAAIRAAGMDGLAKRD